MRGQRILILAVGLFILTGVGFAWAQPAPEMDNYGFTHVLATVYLRPGQGASITVPDQYPTSSPAGDATISIPDSAFSVPVRFQVLAGSNSVYWAVTPTNPSKLVNVNEASVITKDTLKHPAPVASVGWIVTTPANDLPMMTKK